MRRSDVLALVQAHRNSLIQLGVKSLDLFGSVARDEAYPNSDIDFLVEFDQPIGLFQFLRRSLTITASQTVLDAESLVLECDYLLSTYASCHQIARKQ
jgi:predicted nucleotidyltransferase